jgi:hypothetical protein
LVNVLTMALFGVICGADGWEALAIHAEERAEFFGAFLKMPKGTPCADTFRRVFEALDPRAFQDVFRKWLKPILEDLESQTISLDGLRMRPVFHWAPHRIHAHVFLTVLSLLLERVAEQACGETWRNIRDDLRQIKLAQLSWPDGRVWQVIEPRPEARSPLKLLGIANPPTIVDHA